MNKPTPHQQPAHQQQKDAPQHEDKTTPAREIPDPVTHDPKILTEGAGAISVARFTVDGQVKSLNRPISGADLYRICGSPKKLTAGGRAIADDSEPIDLADDAELKASF
jgi:hypothetical protein